MDAISVPKHFKLDKKKLPNEFIKEISDGSDYFPSMLLVDFGIIPKLTVMIRLERNGEIPPFHVRYKRRFFKTSEFIAWLNDDTDSSKTP